VIFARYIFKKMHISKTLESDEGEGEKKTENFEYLRKWSAIKLCHEITICERIGRILVFLKHNPIVDL